MSQAQGHTPRQRQRANQKQLQQQHADRQTVRQPPTARSGCHLSGQARSSAEGQSLRRLGQAAQQPWHVPGAAALQWDCCSKSAEKRLSAACLVLAWRSRWRVSATIAAAMNNTALGVLGSRRERYRRLSCLAREAYRPESGSPTRAPQARKPQRRPRRAQQRARLASVARADRIRCRLRRPSCRASSWSARTVWRAARRGDPRRGRRRRRRQLHLPVRQKRQRDAGCRSTWIGVWRSRSTQPSCARPLRAASGRAAAVQHVARRRRQSPVQPAPASAPRCRAR